MQLKSIIKDSVFGSIATVTGESSLDKAWGFLQYNREFIQQFQNVIIALNKTEECSMDIVIKYENLWHNLVPNTIFIYNPINRSHMFGTIELEEALLRYIGDEFPDKKYLFKSTEDMLLSTKLLEMEVEPADFYSLPGFSYESIQLAGGHEKLFEYIKTYQYPNWTPQTNFYIISLNRNLSSLYGDQVEEKRHVYLKHLENQPNIKPWEINYEDGIKFDMENLLAQTVKPLIKKSLLCDFSIKNLLRFVMENGVGDPSHKNILFEENGLCHFHFPEYPVYTINK